MSELIEALILGIVQGLTEFLPVSSSGHLEIMKVILDDDSLAEQSMLTTVVLHFATAIATLIVFRKDIGELVSGLFNNERRSGTVNYFLLIVCSMVPAVIVGLGFEDAIESLFYRNMKLVGAMLLVTGFLLLLSEKISSSTKPLGFLQSLIIGVSQAIAILPGISRSGATIATGLILGVDKNEIAKFSFLMVIPLIFGKMAKDVLSGELVQNMPSASYLIVGFMAALVAGIFACTTMIRIVKNSKLSYFAFYCFIAGAAVLLYNFF